jgi:hypothetical protein
MEMVLRYLTVGIIWVAVPAAVVAVAPPASADCTSAGAATVCAQGTVRGGGPNAPQAGPAYPGYCADPWYCNDDWDLDVIVNPGPPIDIGRPGRPGPR